MPEKISQLLPVLGAIVAFLCAALLLLYIFRLLFGRRIRSPGARGRPRRLDVVDVFDLDRERQLIIVRRDNIEHLLLIGGPNDVLVEGTINRVEGALGRTIDRQAPPPAGRTTQPEAEPPSSALPGAPIKPATPVNLPPDLFAPAPGKPLAPPPPAAPAPLPPLPPIAARTPASPPISPAPPPRPAPPRAAPPFLARAQQRLAGGAPDDQPPAPAAPPENAPPPAAPKAPPPPVAPKAAPPPPAAPKPAPPPAAQPTSAAPSKDGDPLDSLEAEMARLLGRPDQK